VPANGRGNTQVTDAGLEHLEGLTNLRHLGLRHTQVTEAGIRGLKIALPEISITPTPEELQKELEQARKEATQLLDYLAALAEFKDLRPPQAQALAEVRRLGDKITFAELQRLRQLAGDYDRQRADTAVADFTNASPDCRICPESYLDALRQAGEL